ncbi:hypothetical protein ATE84_2989 [Aquimarina sp. MAR_2010_214]|uniref:hypothetical protein n=1 Tax=Aquimarina sp. MAR_2010_214 TaxID=1250026 RepID=UPI000C7132FA|nr:hypothetical protein [Aquimarina sp. MAR_2010_214]PKV50920.1 hypothetical protein ATE84_2989 [Aquimarina sp. MAR_2010_214]
MKKVFYSLLLIFLSLSLKAQENPLLKQISELEGSDKQVNHVLNLIVTELQEDKIIVELKEKLNSDLNSVISCVTPYKLSESLKLTDEEKKELKKRIVKIADKFSELKYYTLFEFSGGYAPIFGVNTKTIKNKEIVVVMLGGDCSKNKTELKAEEIYTVFNNRMKELMN